LIRFTTRGERATYPLPLTARSDYLLLMRLDHAIRTSGIEIDAELKADLRHRLEATHDHGADG
jgi:hypothetical protein